MKYVIFYLPLLFSFYINYNSKYQAFIILISGMQLTDQVSIPSSPALILKNPFYPQKSVH